MTECRSAVMRTPGQVSLSRRNGCATVNEISVQPVAVSRLHKSIIPLVPPQAGHEAISVIP